MLNYPDPIADTVPSRFPVIAGEHPSSNSGMAFREPGGVGQYKLLVKTVASVRSITSPEGTSVVSYALNAVLHH